MKMLFLLLALPVTTTTFAQRTIDNEVTEQHVRIDGTNVFIIPPPGFVWSNPARQFIQEEWKAGVLINEIETSIDVVHRQMSKKELLGQGRVWISEEALTVSGFHGYLIKASKQTFASRMLEYTLAFGNNKITRVVQCIFPADGPLSTASMERTLLSTVFKPVVDIRKEPFSLAFKPHGFSFWKNVNGINYYKAVEKGGGELFVMTDFFYQKNNSEPELLFLNRMQRLPYSSTRFDDKGIEEMEVDGLSGWRGTITARNDAEQAVYVYQVILQQQQHCFLLQGVSPTLDGIKTFHELFASFRKKP